MMVQVPAALGKTEVNFCPMITIPKVDMTFTFVSVQRIRIWFIMAAQIYTTQLMA